MLRVMAVAELRNYTRWVEIGGGQLRADILGAPVEITADPGDGKVRVACEATLTPDEARLIGVRLVDAAVLADGARAIRQAPPAT